MTAPHLKVINGKPTFQEVAALATVLSQIDSEERNKAAQTGVVRDNWGQPGADFNPSAFRNVRYF
ncbi:hypothetical protein CPHO_09770 [Corynebacterium phocae]|uniref:Acyl-CoA carboxylase subunit epsilon n=1 Tax=Corynebacterium phocae TaxID=161895 RepID=A0A1L7D4R1_9CORY|nr:acyl-CoA carboxylase subunit epsilon [Corynebacterium phocae]APT93129.1 hypothetical protein CPHO_09770 [Corynebacterium phocae]KAA8722204.1 acyl-CoA carboxylase subunit epsilon [Corynebacterium phocae]